MDDGFNSPLLQDIQDRTDAQYAEPEVPEVLADTEVEPEVQTEIEVESDAETVESTPETDMEGWPEDLKQQHKAAIKGMNKAQEEAAHLRKKAELLDRLNENPEALKDYLKALTGGDVDKTSTAPPENSTTGVWDGTNPHSDVDPSQVFDEDTLTGIEAVAYKIITEKVMTMLQPYGRAVEQLYPLLQQNQDASWESVAAEYPAVADKRSEVEAKMKLGLSRDEAIFAVGGKALLEAKPVATPKEAAPKQEAQPAPVSLAKSNGRIPRKSRRAEKQSSAVAGIEEFLEKNGYKSVGELLG